MKKRILALLMAATMVFGLAACGSKEEKATDTNITIWVAENVVDFTKEKAAAWQELSETNKQFTIDVQPVGEGDAAGNMITDVTAGADIYGFAQDQLTRLVTAGALTPVAGDNANFVATQNDAGAVAAAKMGDTTYAYPLTSDNGYFMYYDPTVVTDVSTLDAVVAQCEAAGKSLYFEINSGWYAPAFFFAAGANITYETDDTGAFTKCNVNYASNEGVAALKAMIKLAKSPAFQNGSNVGNSTNAAVVVSGTWDKDAAFGKGLTGCAKLPTIDLNGKQVQMSGFGGFKLLGIKPQTDSVKLAACHSLAQYLSGEEVQLARFNAVGWGPSNLKAQASEAVKADAALSALAEQLAFTIPQGQYPGDYWTRCTALGDDIIADLYDNKTDAELLEVLTQLQNDFISYK